MNKTNNQETKKELAEQIKAYNKLIMLDQTISHSVKLILDAIEQYLKLL